MSSRLGVVVLVGVLVRVYLSTKSGLDEWLQTRVEISTPTSSWPRALEGLYMKRVLGISPYDGDLVHEMPLMLELYGLLVSFVGAKYMFIIVDCINALLLYHVVKSYMAYSIRLDQFNHNNGRYAKFKRCQELVLSDKNYDRDIWPLFATCFYLFNPFGLASCAGMSTIVIHNLLLLLWLHFLLTRSNQLLCLLCLAIHANITVYSASLIVATLGLQAQRKFYLNKLPVKSSFFVLNTAGFAILCGVVFVINYALAGFDWRFVESTYLFILRVPDLSPNGGLFWYFLTEMFDHFLNFFVYVFQLNAFVYAVPLTVRLRDQPVINLALQIGLLSVVKSYPNVGETGLYISLLVPLWSYLFQLMRNFLVYSCMLTVSVILAPCMFYLWLGSGGGNANFYFAITLVFSAGQFFLLADVLYAHLKREFIMTNGDQCPIDSNTKSPAFLALD